MKPHIVFVVVINGVAQPAGSKTGYVPTDADGQPYRRANGTIICNIVDANPKSKGWKAHVRNQAFRVWGARKLLDCPLYAEVVFYKERPKGHFGTGRNSERLKDSADAFPTGSPDALKLMRGVEDALTSVVYRDDALIVSEFISKRYGSPARVEIQIGVLPVTVADVQANGG